MAEGGARLAIRLLQDAAERGDLDPWDVDVIAVVDGFLDQLRQRIEVPKLVAALNKGRGGSYEQDLAETSEAFLAASVLVSLKAEVLEAQTFPAEPELEDGFDFDFDAEGQGWLLTSGLELPRKPERHLLRRPVAPPPLQRPVTLGELIRQLEDIAEFFQGRDIDGKRVYGAAIFTERGSEGITMGATGALYSWGFQYQNPNKPYDMEGFVNSPDAVAALEFYKELYKCCTPPGYTDSYMEEGLDAFKSGQVAMMMNWFAFFPGLHKDPVVGGDKIGFFVNPGQKVEASTLGGQGISVVSYSEKKDQALEYIKWFASPEVQKKWWSLGGYSCHKSVLLDPGFANTQPFAADFLKAMDGVQDFWQEPAYAELLLAMQKRVHDFVVADQGTAQEALDKLIEDWTETFEDEGKL